jgi:hypothetical protein
MKEPQTTAEVVEQLERQTLPNQARIGRVAFAELENGQAAELTKRLLEEPDFARNVRKELRRSTPRQ